MGEAKGVEIGEVEHLSSNRYPRDLLQRFTATNHHRHHQTQTKLTEANEDTEEIELNLGLSLGGRFGVDPKENKLVRSTSIAGLTTFLREDDAAAPPPVVYPLNRTSSLPMESEEEWRKRKELQSLRRMEAKRKRSEKQKSIRNSKDQASLERNCEEKRAAADGSIGLQGFLSNSQQQFMLANGFTPPFGMPNWATSGQGPVVDSSPNVLAAAPAQGFIPPSSQGSAGSHGSSSSGISEFESRPVQGLGNCNETRSPASVHSVVEPNEQKPIIAPTPPTDTKPPLPTKAEVESPSKKPRMTENVIKETGMKVMEEMPCVSTKGDGPNGRRIEGFLYKYKKGEEVRIVCVCHGSFLTPAEFVKHAGGGDVAHPLRHIVVVLETRFSVLNKRRKDVITLGNWDEVVDIGKIKGDPQTVQQKHKTTPTKLHLTVFASIHTRENCEKKAEVIDGQE